MKTASDPDPWYVHEPVELRAYPPIGGSLPGTRTWPPICFFPENVEALNHLTPQQFKWAMNLIFACFREPLSGEPDRPIGSLLALWFENFWLMVGARSKEEWMRDCEPVLALFYRNGDYIYPKMTVVAFAELINADDTTTDGGTGKQSLIQ